MIKNTWHMTSLQNTFSIRTIRSYCKDFGEEINTYGAAIGLRRLATLFFAPSRLRVRRKNPRGTGRPALAARPFA